MKKTTLLVLLLVGLLAVTGCSGDNQSEMLKYDLTLKVKDVDGNSANGAAVTVDDTTKTADKNGVVQFKDLVSDTYNVTAKDGTKYEAEKKVTIQGRDTTADLALKYMVIPEDTNDDGSVYLYASDGTATADDIEMNVGKWDTGSNQNDSYTDDADFSPVYRVQSGSGWGKPAACLAFEDFTAGFADSYSKLKFKVHSENGLSSIFVKFDNMAGNVGKQIEYSYSGDHASAISSTTNNWYEMTIPLSDFTDHGDGVYEQFGIHSGYNNEDTLRITDIQFVE